VRDGDLAESRADVDVTLRAERLQEGLDAGILRERLDECADGELHHRSHLVFQLRELRRGKSLVEPRMVGFEIELRVADEKIRWTIAAKRLEPCIGALEISFEGGDVGRLRRDHAPTENADSLPLRHGAAF
jgi:hypothetical protein